MATETDLERYADPQAFAREVNLPLLGVARVAPIPSGAGLTTLLSASSGDALANVVDGLAETRQSLTLRTLLLAGFPHDPECFAVGLALGREWSRRGLRVAIVDLDFWNPTVWRPGAHPNEGFVDVLEYGCSIGRVAWEVVADSLWLIGPGSHPPDEDRIVDHPDWQRAARVLAMFADVTLFVVPLLDRRGFTGKLSKLMDGALLLASVERTARADLRDAFLELWGSDAPMIGCVGIESLPVAPRRSVPSAIAMEGDVPDVPRSEGSVPTGAAVAAATVAVSDRPAAARAASAPAAASSATPAATPAPAARARGSASAQARLTAEERELEQQLEREVRRGVVKRPPVPGLGRSAVWVGVAALIAVGIGIVRLMQTPGLAPSTGAVIQNRQAGDETVRPATTPIDAGLAREPSGSVPSGIAPTPAPSQQAPPERAASQRTPPAPAATRSEGDASLPYSVHVASFRSKEKVQDLVRSLAMKGLDAWYEPAADMPGWHRVFVGRFATEAEAKAYASYLLENHFVDRANASTPTAR